MPQITIPFSDENSIPAELKAFKAPNANTVTVWVGDNVAAETNPALEAKRTELLGEKKTLQDKYDSLVQSTAGLANEVNELRVKVADKSGNTVTPDELAIVSAVKQVMPAAKADDVKTVLTKYPTLVTDFDKLQSQEKNRKVFALTGFKNEVVFSDLMSNKDKNPNLVDLAVETETVDGKPVEKLYAKVKDAQGAISKQPFADYVKANTAFTDYLPALSTGPGNQSQTTETPSWMPQTPSGGGGNGDDKTAGKTFLEQHIAKINEQNQAKPNALLNTKQAPPTAEAVQN